MEHSVKTLQFSDLERNVVSTGIAEVLFPHAGLPTYALNKISTLQFSASVSILFPSLKHRHGGCFFDWVSDESIDDWVRKGIEISIVERTLNEVHVYDFFHQEEGVSNALALAELVLRLLLETWSQHLPVVAKQAVRLECSGEPESYGPTITFSCSSA